MSDAVNTAHAFEILCQRLTNFIGSHSGTVTALVIFIITLPVFLFIPTSKIATLAEDVLTLLSFVLLFFLQRSQSKDTLSLNIKLNELIIAGDKADSTLINVEHKSEAELQDLHDTLIALHTDTEAV